MRIRHNVDDYRFVKIAQLGMAEGLETPFEWYASYMRFMPHALPYGDVPREERRARKAFLSFLRGCGGCPEEDAELQQLTEDTLDEYVDKQMELARVRMQKHALLLNKDP